MPRLHATSQHLSFNTTLKSTPKMRSWVRCCGMPRRVSLICFPLLRPQPKLCLMRFSFTNCLVLISMYAFCADDSRLLAHRNFRPDRFLGKRILHLTIERKEKRRLCGDVSSNSRKTAKGLFAQFFQGIALFGSAF